MTPADVNAHWRALSKAVRNGIMEKMMLGLRQHSGPGIPLELRLQLVRERLAELEAEASATKGQVP